MKWMFNVKNALNSENGSAIDIRFTFNPIITLYSGYMSVLYISSTHPLMLLISSLLLSSTQMWWGSARCAVCSLLIRVIKITHSYALKDVTMANPVQNLRAVLRNCRYAFHQSSFSFVHKTYERGKRIRSGTYFWLKQQVLWSASN